MKQTMVSLLIILLTMMWASSPVYGKISRRESDALRTLFNAAGGSNWLKIDNWQGAPGTENTWYGISCNADNTTVLKIDLRGNNLEGTLPPDLSDLSNLRTLLLSNNQLKNIHKDLGKLSKLTTLDLSNNQLTGAIPAWIAKLKNLKRLNLSNNWLSGQVPSWIGDMKNLEELILDGNKLSGPIPAQVGNLSRLKVLKIGHNRMIGEIPSPLSSLIHLADNRSNFKWNGLYTNDASLRTFLNKKQKGNDWESTQTVAPREIEAVSPDNTSIIISWKPIAYTGDSGGYRVYYSTAAGGPYNEAGATSDKMNTKMKIKNLRPSTSYFFVIRTWTDGHGSNRNSIESGFSKEIAATTRGTTISGSVKTSEGQGVAGVKMKASHNGGITFTDPTGDYHLNVTPGWSGTVTPSKAGYDISPSTQQYSPVNADLDGQDYQAEAVTKISGRVTDSKGSGVPGVTLTFSNREEKITGTVTTDSTGNYIYVVPYNWAGKAVPSKTGYKFEPLEIDFPGVVSAEPGKGYKAFMLPVLRGWVKTRSGKGMPNVIMTFSGEEKTKTPQESFKLKTDENGEYSKKFIKDWSGSVKPEKPGYRFYPSRRKYKNMTMDTLKKAENYRTELDWKFFINVTGNQMVSADKNFDDIYGKSLFAPGIEIGYKIYRDFYIWGGYSFTSKNGTIPVFEEQAKWKQTFLSFGLGYNGNLSTLLGYKIDIGMLLVNYREEAFEESLSENTFGMKIDGAGIIKISDRLFTEISVGYLFANDIINNEDYEIKIKLGGLRAGIGLGLRF